MLLLFLITLYYHSYNGKLNIPQFCMKSVVEHKALFKITNTNSASSG